MALARPLPIFSSSHRHWSKSARFGHAGEGFLEFAQTRKIGGLDTPPSRAHLRALHENCPLEFASDHGKLLLSGRAIGSRAVRNPICSAVAREKEDQIGWIGAWLEE